MARGSRMPICGGLASRFRSRPGPPVRQGRDPVPLPRRERVPPGVIQLHGEAHDYRDQAIAQGRLSSYGHQPVNGDHLGVSPFGDYVLLLPGAKDTSLTALPRKQLDTESSESTGSSHPAVCSCSRFPRPCRRLPSMIHDSGRIRGGWSSRSTWRSRESRSRWSIPFRSSWSVSLRRPEIPVRSTGLERTTLSMSCRFPYLSPS